MTLSLPPPVVTQKQCVTSPKCQRQCPPMNGARDARNTRSVMRHGTFISMSHHPRVRVSLLRRAMYYQAHRPPQPRRRGRDRIIVPSTSHRTGMLLHSFEHPDLKLHRVQFVTSLINVQMRGWLESFGVEVEYRMREAWVDGQGSWLDIVGYSILESEWPRLKARMGRKLTARLGASFLSKSRHHSAII